MSEAVSKPEQSLTLSQRFAAKYGADPKQLFQTLKNTAFKQREGVEITDSQMMALIIVANQYNLNPFTKEIYAYPDKNGGIVPVVGVDGWNKMAQDTGDMDGLEFVWSEEVETPNKAKECPLWCEAVVTRKSVSKPYVVREYLNECFQDRSFVNPWQTHTKRMLRHKAMIQGLRVAFGFAGIYDEDEAQRVLKAQDAKFEIIEPVQLPTAKAEVKEKQEKTPRAETDYKSLNSVVARIGEIKNNHELTAWQKKHDAELSMFPPEDFTTLQKAIAEKKLAFGN